jgi:hypothetical protein
MADYIADDQGDAGAGEPNYVEPVAAHAGVGAGRQVPAGDLNGRLLRKALRQQAALQGERRCPFVRVPVRVVKRQCSSGCQLLGEQDVVLFERLRTLATDECGNTKSHAASSDRHRQNRVQAELADRCRPHRVVTGCLEERGIVRADEHRLAGRQSTR